MDHSSTTLAAAELADHYIELILSTQPELLVADLSDADAEEIVHQAERLALYRQTLIEQLQEQPLPNDFSADMGDDEDDEEDDEDEEDE